MRAWVRVRACVRACVRGQQAFERARARNARVHAHSHTVWGWLWRLVLTLALLPSASVFSRACVCVPCRVCPVFPFRGWRWRCCVVGGGGGRHMWSHPATGSSLQRLAEWGCVVVEPADKLLVCGDTGRGAMAPVEDIVARLTAEAGRLK
jgi:hypothetical protein